MKPALRLLARLLPPDDGVEIVNDLEELYRDRIASGSRWNEAWLWAQAAGLAIGLAGARRHPPDTIEGSRLMRLNRRLGVTMHQAVRRLRYEWRYAVGVVVILAVGIGPATAMLAVVQKVLLQPLAYQAPAALGIMRMNLGQLQAHPGLTPGEVIDLRYTTGLFASVEAASRQAEMSLARNGDFVPLSSIQVTTGMLPMLGVQPILGRPFSEDDLKSSGLAAVLLDNGVWRSLFGGDPNVIGQHIVLNGNSVEVIGVLPPHFQLATGRAVPHPIDVYTPMRLTMFRNFWGFTTLVRLAPGVTVQQVNAALPGLAAALTRQYPEAYAGTGLQFFVTPLKDDMVKATQPALRAAIAGVLLLLGIAMANATALVVARLRTRERDFALRLAVGATRGSLVADVLVESVLLSLCGAVMGAALGALGIAAARQLVPHTVPRWDAITLDAGVVLDASALALVGLATCGLIPLVRASRQVPWQALQSGSTRSGRAETAFSRVMLAGAQVALTVVLGFGALQLVRSARHLSEIDLGFDANVLTFRVPVDFRALNLTSTEKTVSLYERLRARLAELPGVEAVGAVSHLPLSGSFLTDGWTSDLTKTTGWDLATANYYATLPGYFDAVKIPFRQGRDFTDAEDRGAQHVIIIDESLARAAFPGVPNVIGRTLRLGWGIPDSQVVGVVGHVRGIDIAREVRPQIYAPIGLFGQIPNFTVRATGDPTRLIDSIQHVVKELNTGRAVAGFAMLSDNVTAATSTLKSVTELVSLLAASAGLLSAIGLYAVIAYLLHARRRATAIRSALGASPGQLVRLHLRTSARILLVALPVGALLAWAAAPVFGSLVYGVAARDAWSLLGGVAIAVGASVAGTYIPVRRAAAIDPILALRSE
jgi:predicted permease